MKLPRVLLAVPLLAAGLFVPALAVPLADLAPTAIGMGHDEFLVDGAEPDGIPEFFIRAGDTLTFQNNSRWIHVLAPGHDGLVGAAGNSALAETLMLEENDSYTTEPWRVSGTYHITCPVHPDMNATVVVQP